MIEHPIFIVFEGIDGSGKSTQARRVASYLKERGVPAVGLAEPTGGPHGREIRRLLQSGVMPPAELQLELFLLDRETDVRDNILPALKSGISVVMDRYYFSNAAYQAASGLSARDILDRNIACGFPKPDRVYFVDIDPDTALERISRRNGTGSADIFEQAAFLKKVRDAYRDIADCTFAIVDGSGQENRIFEFIIKELKKNFLID